MKNKPLVSFCIFAYNQENYIKSAIESALNQEYESLEIIISDDCSSDNTIDIIEETCSIYQGPHKIIVNRNKENLGIREHCNKVLYEIASGEIILLAGGDDISLPNRTTVYVDMFLKYPEVMSISCLSKEVNENLEPIDITAEYDGSYSIFNINDYIQHEDFIIYSGDSRGLRRDVIDKFPPLIYPRAEDIYLFIRSLLLGSACYIRKPLVLRRNHDNNASKIRTKQYNDFKMQTLNDIYFAYNQGFISKTKKIQMVKKVMHIKEVFEIYWNSPYSSLKTFFYRVLHKLFNVKKSGGK